jgi:hypothetical protein
MARTNWRVPKPSGVVSSRDLARNTSRILDTLKAGSGMEEMTAMG